MRNNGKWNIVVEQILKIQYKRDRQCTYNVTLRRVLATTFDMKE